MGTRLGHLSKGGVELAKTRTKGECYRPIVTVDKTKNGKPTVLKVSGERYIMDGKTRSISKKNWSGRKNY
ncbi:hypothetical protein [Salinibacillus kushneri]|uniref:hypothetical protein n=1 Tax=Salinibacillus kushneri TaxID=237682 RepID=UPI0015A6BA0A|nr:hypothetical protein [Salinibacillus kushneri]